MVSRGKIPPIHLIPFNRQGNINLFEVAVQQGVKKAVYVSLLNAEKARKAKVMLAKRAVERFLEDSTLDYTVFRPSGLFHDFVEVFETSDTERQGSGTRQWFTHNAASKSQGSFPDAW